MTTPTPKADVFAIIVPVTCALVAIGLVLYVLTPSSGRARPTANFIKCESNLRQIGQAYQLYLRDFRAPPPDLVTLAVAQNLELYHLACEVPYPERLNSMLPVPQQAAAARAKPLKYVGYEYIHRTTPAGRDEIVAYDRLTNHADYFSEINVLFGDGRIDRLKVADVEQMLQAPTK